MITLKQYTMDIKKVIDELNARRSTLEKQIASAKEEIKAINVRERKLQTILKHAEAALTGEELEPAEHPEA